MLLYGATRAAERGSATVKLPICFVMNVSTPQISDKPNILFKQSSVLNVISEGPTSLLFTLESESPPQAPGFPDVYYVQSLLSTLAEPPAQVRTPGKINSNS